MKACGRCKWTYPPELLNPLHVGDVCGQCALEMGNEIHGARRTRFVGAQAEAMRLRGLRWRTEHPELAPAREAS